MKRAGKTPTYSRAHASRTRRHRVLAARPALRCADAARPRTLERKLAVARAAAAAAAAGDLHLVRAVARFVDVLARRLAPELPPELARGVGQVARPLHRDVGRDIAGVEEEHRVRAVGELLPPHLQRAVARTSRAWRPSGS